MEKHYDVRVHKIENTDKYHLGIISWADMDCVYEGDLSAEEVLSILDKYDIINNFNKHDKL